MMTMTMTMTMLPQIPAGMKFDGMPSCIYNVTADIKGTMTEMNYACICNTNGYVQMIKLYADTLSANNLFQI